MKKFLAATIIAGALGATTAVVAAVNPLATAGAQTSTPAPAESERPIASVLAGLVADGTITQQQADVVAARLAEFRREHRPWRYAVRDSLSVAASTIGIDVRDLVKELRSGQSIAADAQDHGVSERAVVDAIVGDLSTQIDQAVAAGKLTAERADTIKSRLPDRVQHFVEVTRGTHRTPATTSTTAG